jgi:hypothetical protein
MSDIPDLQCPYCLNKLNCVSLMYDDERFTVGDAMLCSFCGQFGALEGDWTIRQSTNEDMEKWSLANPIDFEKFEMMAADFRRNAARRQEEST